jgi:hypothetical protein
MEDGGISQSSSDRLAKALSAILGHANITSKLSQVLAYAVVKGTVSYQEVKEIIKDNPEDVILLADKWRLLLPVKTAKSSGWEDRLLIIKDDEVYEIPNVIRYLAREAVKTGIWNPEKAIITLCKELGDPDCQRIPGLVRSIVQVEVNHKITGNQIKMVCLQLGLGNRVDGLIAELKAAGIISPRLSSVPEVNREGSPLYELNPSVAIGLSP